MTMINYKNIALLLKSLSNWEHWWSWFIFI